VKKQEIKSDETGNYKDSDSRKIYRKSYSEKRHFSILPEAVLAIKI
jgi:hypothetical protein